MNEHPRRLSAQRRVRAVERARVIVQAIVDGRQGHYEGYRALYSIYLQTSGAAEELKPLFRLPGIEPDGTIHVNDEFRRTVMDAAVQWLKKNSK
jgi:hypothetical protein